MLLKRLEISYRVTGVPLQWLNSYLEGRVQTILINLSRSSAVKRSCVVSQGSVLRPILCVFYIKDVSAIIKRHGLWSHWYADDTHVYFYCKPDEVDSLAQKFAARSDELCAWMRSSRLKLNADKTECMWMNTRQRQPTFTVKYLAVEGPIIVPINGALNLGVFFDCNLNLKQHIFNMCRTCYFQLRQLRTAHRSFPRIFSSRCYTSSSRVIVDWITVTPCLLDYLYVTLHIHNLSRMPQHVFLVAYQSWRAYNRCSEIFFTGYQSINV